MVAGHDRGARVTHRMCLDHPEKVIRASIHDIIPQHHLFNNMTQAWATGAYHWFFMIQPSPMPETLMSADPDFYITKKLSKTAQGLSFFGKEALAEYMRCFRNPETVRGMCEDYRACASVDLAMDTEDRAAGKTVTLPVQILWGASGAVGRQNKPAEVWKAYATDIRDAQALPCGHYLSEEAPEETYAAMRKFFTAA
jgi:haloacetate dehalogenase